MDGFSSHFSYWTVLFPHFVELALLGWVVSVVFPIDSLLQSDYNYARKVGYCVPLQAFFVVILGNFGLE